MTSREDHWLEALPTFARADRIARTIYQTFPTATLPPHLEANAERLKADNPGWSYRLYDDADCERFILDEYGPAVLALYQRLNPEYGPARADLFRYLLIYAKGGVYLDIKSSFDRPIDTAVAETDLFILAHWDNTPDGEHPGFGLHAEVARWPAGEFQQWHVIAAAGHPFLRHAIALVLSRIEAYRPWRYGVGRIGVLRVTGPIAYTLAIRPVLDLHPHRLVANSGDLGLRYSIADGYSHGAVFKRHYANLTTPVASIPVWAKPPAALYGYLKRRQQRRAERDAQKAIGQPRSG